MKIPEHFGGEMWKVVASDLSRYSLNHFYLDVEASMLVATDGHALMVLPVTVDEGETSSLVPRVAIRALIKGRRRKAALHVSEDIVLTFGNGEVRRYPRPEGKYPAWASVLRKHEGPLTVSVDAHRLAELADALGAVHGQVDLWIGSPTEAIVVSPNMRYQTGAFGVLMPCMSSADKAPALPEPTAIAASEVSA